MIIGHYHPDIWAPGGIATYIRRIAEAQRAMGHKVCYFSQVVNARTAPAHMPTAVAHDADLFAQAAVVGLDVLHIHRPISVKPPSSLTVVRTLHGHEPYCPNGGKFLTRWNKPCDRVYSPYGCFWGHLVDHCGSIRPQNLIGNWKQLYNERAILPDMPVIAVSHFLKDCMTRLGYPSDSIHVLHLFPPDTCYESPPPTSGIPNFVFIGRISHQKGLNWLLHSFKKVKTPAHLDIAGTGDEEPAMKQLAERLNLTDRVTFHGWVSPDQVTHFVRSSRAVIFPSVWHEPAGFISFEAMSNSRALIASQVGGIPEVVRSGVNGLLVQPNNIDELSAAIGTMATDYDLATKLGKTGWEIANREFALDMHMTRLMDIYKQTIKLVI